ncbi:hypothetical protein [Planococcus dechangensis]|uniref:DUF3955 domain-containing protein n=1 Tax=Planococcus dechangensis TaxID=1176255 RepID=A0ABV9MCD0_9BACL
MKKLSISLMGGLVLGLVLSFFFFDYESITNEHKNLAGVDQTVREMDFDFVFNASLLMIGISIFIYLVWSLISMKKEQKFLKDYAERKREKK